MQIISAYSHSLKRKGRIQSLFYNKRLVRNIKFFKNIFLSCFNNNLKFSNVHNGANAAKEVSVTSTEDNSKFRKLEEPGELELGDISAT
jgi:hypothetical protein